MDTEIIKYVSEKSPEKITVTLLNIIELMYNDREETTIDILKNIYENKNNLSSKIEKILSPSLIYYIFKKRCEDHDEADCKLNINCEWNPESGKCSKLINREHERIFINQAIKFFILHQEKGNSLLTQDYETLKKNFLDY